MRDALCSIPSFITWPCDEINYIWRYGNRDFPTDELETAHASRARPFVRKAFARRQAKAPDAVVVEKTCANSLRVGFVHALIPEARFVLIVRDPFDVVASAMRRWTAPLDVPYIARKMRFVPARDLVPYGLRFLRSRVARWRSDERRVSTWGPRFRGMDELTRSGAPLVEIVSAQWARCVELSHEQLAPFAPHDVYHVSYERLVRETDSVLGDLVAFAERDVASDVLHAAARTIHSQSIGIGQKQLCDEEKAVIARIARRTAAIAGYTV